MLDLLSGARRWYMDGTFKVVCEPFKQLFMIHAFLRKGTSVKQPPLLFVLMSGKRKYDYRGVFEYTLCRLLHPRVPAVSEVVMDFEAAIWKAATEELPNVSMKGCAYHWAQRIWKKVQHLGLQTYYVDDGDIKEYIRCLLALPFLPPQEIQGMFYHLKGKAETRRFRELTQYIQCCGCIM